MSAAPPTRATLDDLYKVEGKAELVNGRIVHAMASGDLPTDVANAIFVSLWTYVRSLQRGVAKADGIGYTVPHLPSGRESFSPDASYYDGPRPVNRMRFIEGAPNFAVEVRSENDYGNAAEADLAAKRVDYFQAGTQVVWDVDPLAETVTVYRGDAQVPVAIFRRGDTADAEPAVPGWRMMVADMFAP
jgi:Uma2 family endonuclease